MTNNDNNTNNHSGPSHIRPEIAHTADLLRRAADGELTEAEQQQLDAHLADHPADSARIETDRALGLRAAEVMGAVSAPAGLAERVKAAVHAEQIAERIETQAPATRDRSIWRGGGGVLALAAAAAMLVTTVLIVRPGAEPPVDGPFVTAVQFVGEEHVHCVSDLTHAARKFVVADTEKLPEAVQGVTGRTVDLSHINELVAAGFDFEGAGGCGVPGGPAFHLSFVGAEGSEWAGQRVSVFVQAAEAPRLQEGVTYKAVRGSESGSDSESAYEDSDTSETHAEGSVCEGAASVYFWKSGDSVFYLVTDSTVCDKPARSAFQAPARTESLQI